MKKQSKSEKIRKELETGKSPKEVAAALKLPISSVYTVNWKRKKALVRAKAISRLKKVQLRESEVELAKKMNIPIKTYAKEKAKLLLANKSDPALDFLREELASVERQIDNLNTVASFLTIRLRQLEQNG